MSTDPSSSPSRRMSNSLTTLTAGQRQPMLFTSRVQLVLDFLTPASLKITSLTTQKPLVTTTNSWRYQDFAITFWTHKLWFKSYPNFLKNDFYIAGESYAGTTPSFARLTQKAFMYLGWPNKCKKESWRDPSPLNLRESWSVMDFQMPKAPTIFRFTFRSCMDTVCIVNKRSLLCQFGIDILQVSSALSSTIKYSVLANRTRLHLIALLSSTKPTLSFQESTCMASTMTAMANVLYVITTLQSFIVTKTYNFYRTWRDLLSLRTITWSYKFLVSTLTTLTPG